MPSSPSTRTATKPCYSRARAAVPTPSAKACGLRAPALAGPLRSPRGGPWPGFRRPRHGTPAPGLAACSVLPSASVGVVPLAARLRQSLGGLSAAASRRATATAAPRAVVMPGLRLQVKRPAASPWNLRTLAVVLPPLVHGGDCWSDSWAEIAPSRGRCGQAEGAARRQRRRRSARGVARQGGRRTEEREGLVMLRVVQALQRCFGCEEPRGGACSGLAWCVKPLLQHSRLGGGLRA